MSVVVTFRCAGCDASQEVPVRREWEWCFRTPSPGEGGAGAFRVPRIADVVPEGWVYPDRYTGCCYCSACWAGIVAEVTP